MMKRTVLSTLLLTLLCAVGVLGQTPPGGYGPGNGSSSSGGTSTSNGSVGAVFNVLNYGWVDDDTTDNCGSPVTNFMAAVNGYTGPGIAQAIIPEGTSLKAYKLNSCNMIFTIPVDIHGFGTIDCGTGVTTAFCIQLGPTGLANFTNAQTPPYKLQDIGLAGCLNVTVACIGSPVWVSNPQIIRVHSQNTGAGNAALNACTNYFISFDGHNNAPQVIDTVYWNTDSTTGRCWMINNRTAASGGTNSGLFEHNTVVAAGAAPGFTAPCGAIGHSELGSATILKGNQFYGFGQPILLVNPQFGVMIASNQVDQAGCTTGVASADIQYGTSGNLAVGQITITNNYFPGGAGHAGSAIALSTGSTSALSSIIFNGNIASGSAVKNVIAAGAPPTCTGDCIITNNVNFAADSAVINWLHPVLSTSIGGQVTQAADVAAQQLVASVPASAVYRVSCELKITQAATTSSTLPACFIGYTDADTSTVLTKMITPNWAATTPSCSGGTTNTVGNSCGGQAAVTAKVGTAISYSTSGYASSGATPMQFTIRGRAEKLN